MRTTGTRCAHGAEPPVTLPRLSGLASPSQGADDVPTGDSVGRQQGVLVDWNDERGFGFITPSAGGSRVFVHVSGFPRGQRPVSGC